MFLILVKTNRKRGRGAVRRWTGMIGPEVLGGIHLDGCVVAQLSDRIIWYIDTPWLGDRYNLTMVAGSDKFEIE